MWPKRFQFDESFCRDMDRVVDERFGHRGDEDQDQDEPSPHCCKLYDYNNLTKDADADDHDTSTDKRQSEENRTKKNINRTIIHLFARELFIFLSRFCRLELDNDLRNVYRCCRPTASRRRRRPEAISVGNKLTTGKHSDGGKQHLTISALTSTDLLSWPNISLVLYLLCTIVILISVHHHYIYDFNHLHLKRLRQANVTNQRQLLEDYIRSNLSEQKLEQLTESALESLKPLGAPFLNASYAPECIYMVIAYNTFNCFIVISVYGNFVGSLDFHLIRFVMNRNNERKNFNRLICEQCNSYLNSAYNFAEISISRCLRSNGQITFDPNNYDTKGSRTHLRSLLANYENTIRTLKHLALECKLQPLNKNDKYLDRFELIYCLAMLALILVSITLALVVMLIVPRLVAFPIRSEPADLMALVEIGTLWMFMCASAVFFVSYSLTNTVDQILLISELNGHIRQCISENTCTYRRFSSKYNQYQCRATLTSKVRPPIVGQQKTFAIDIMGQLHHRSSSCFAKQPRSQPTGQWQQFDHQQPQLDLGPMVEANSLEEEQTRLAIQMSNNLIFLLIHYKIFVAKLKSIQKSFGFCCVPGTIFSFSLPVLARFHVPYMSQGVKLYIIMVSVIIIIIANWAVAPACLLNVKCLRLYNKLWGLLAHSIDITTDTKFARLYDKHTIWMLRKELNHPDRLSAQFSTTAFGISYTLSTLIRLYFWLGLITISLLADVDSGQLTILGSLFSDPLGILRVDKITW